MSSLRPNQALVAERIILDGRLALFHQTERWLAVADPHFGYELSQRAAGWLVPMWGMQSIAGRLSELLDEYEPSRLLILGDLVHDRTAASAAAIFLNDLACRCETIVVAGNHDRRVKREIAMVESWETESFYFHHGHCEADAGERIQIIGHHHPAGVVTDGAGLRLKCPAFVQQARCWIMPAFSPWAGGTRYVADESSRIWLCTPERVLPLPGQAAA